MKVASSHFRERGRTALANSAEMGREGGFFYRIREAMGKRWYAQNPRQLPRPVLPIN
jgi:hypothetical protein